MGAYGNASNQCQPTSVYGSADALLGIPLTNLLCAWNSPYCYICKLFADSLINFLQFNQRWVCFYWYLLWSVPCCWSPCSLACHKWTWKSGEAQEQSHATKYKLLLVLKFIYCPICSYFYMWYNVQDCFTGGPFYKPFSFVLLLQELWLSQPNTVSDTICNVR